jgi:hypothetical protein
MRVVVGPVRGESARAWLAHAHGVVDDLDRSPRSCPATPELLDVFRGYLAEWDGAATEEKFCWERDIPVEEAKYHVHAFHQVAEMLSVEADGRDDWRSPDEGVEFVLALLTGVLGALQAEDPASAAFAQHVGQFWPNSRLCLR